MMARNWSDILDPSVKMSYRGVVLKHNAAAPAIAREERFAFYEWARRAFEVAMTGEIAAYSNLILRKGVALC